MERKLLVGYARVDITPEQYTHLGGNGLPDLTATSMQTVSSIAPEWMRPDR